MARQLPRNRSRLRLLTVVILPAYLVLWIGGTGCFGDVQLFRTQVNSCLFSVQFFLFGDAATNELLTLITFTTGVNLYLPIGQVALSGSSSGEARAFRAFVRFRNAVGKLLEEWVMDVEANGSVSGHASTGGVMLEPRSTIQVAVRWSNVLRAFSGLMWYTPASEGPQMPSFSFPAEVVSLDALGRVKFTNVFDAEFGVDYPIPAGDLVIEGTVEVSEDAKVKVPRKVILEIAHLAANGKVLSKHKQIVKIKRSGKFKTSTKAFVGYDVSAGERVRVRVKPKGGDLTGLNWTLMPGLIF